MFKNLLLLRFKKKGIPRNEMNTRERKCFCAGQLSVSNYVSIGKNKHKLIAFQD